VGGDGARDLVQVCGLVERGGMSATARHCYQACGLILACDALLPGLRSIAGDARPDVTIFMRGEMPAANETTSATLWYVSPELDACGRPEMTIQREDAGYRLTYCEDATFFVDRAGRYVTAHWARSLTDIDAASYLASSVLAFILRIRGWLPLHASAVVIDGHALVFVGDSWSGKSSTAAAFSTLGYPILSDDIVRIDVCDGQLVAFPGHPRVNVWSDSAAALFERADGLVADLPVHSATYQKHHLDLIDAGVPFQSSPVPIEAVYMLEERAVEGQSALTERLTPREALMSLVRHTFGNCFLDAAMRAKEFEVLARLVECVPVRELRFGDDLGRLVSSCRAIADSRNE
jgi:hypothetical protein